MDSVSSATERRKQVRVRLRRDLRIFTHPNAGGTSYVVKDPVSQRYYRFQRREHFLLQLMDGKHTLDEARREYDRRFPPQRLRLDELEGFAQLLVKSGLAHSTSADTGRQLFEKYREHRRSRRRRLFSDIACVRIPLFDPDRLLAALLRPLRWLFTSWFLLVSGAVIASALALVIVHFDLFRERLPSFQQFLSPATLLYLWAALALVKIVHELGHGLSCKAFGGECHEMGALILCLSPALYCNVSDAWTLPNKWKRIIISFAGIYVELIIAAIATFVWWNTPGEPFINNMSLSLMVVCSVSTVIFNGNPLMRYDGYYVLADWLEIPNLKDRARRCFRSAFLRYALGIRARPEELTTTRRRWFLFFYALASFAYRWIVTAGVLWFLYRLLAPYGLGTLVGLVAMAAGASMILEPLHRAIRALIGGSNRASVDRRYAVLAGAMMTSTLALMCFMPLPLGGVCRTGLIEMQPDAVEQVFVPAPAILERLHVRNGQAVHTGDVVAEFRSVDLENKLAESRTGRDIKEMELEALDEASSRPESAAERARIDLDRTAAAAERDALQHESEMYDAMIKRLVLRAPKDGVIFGAPPREQIGKAWYPENPAPFCMIAEPGRLRAIVALSPADNSLLRDEARKTFGPEIAIRVAGTGTRRWQGRLASLPESESNDLPLALTTRGGGPIPVHQTALNRYEPYSQQYLATVNFVAADSTVVPGCLAQVRIHARSRPLAWWLWRRMCATLGS